MIAADVPGSNESRMTSMSSSFTRVWALISNDPNPMSSRFSSRYDLGHRSDDIGIGSLARKGEDDQLDGAKLHGSPFA